MTNKLTPMPEKKINVICDLACGKCYEVVERNQAVDQALKREGEVKERLRRIISAFGNVNLQKNEIRQLIADMERK